ncbi:MAG TPA: hypothetical protein VMW16_13590 [Sedimentisphaerales bacterium]|nr:hypothetical protein [Sedimentisphaerales bacterium]
MELLHENIPQEALGAKNTYRARLELLRSRVSLLTGEDRLLMTMYLENGNSYRQMARLAGVNEANIARRIQRLSRRLIEGEYILCLRNRDRLTEDEMALAREHFLLGLPQRKIAEKRKWTLYQVRKTVERIRRLVKRGDAV